MITKCPSCGFENPDSSLFCGGCAKELPKSSNVGKADSAGQAQYSYTRLCVSCGRALDWNVSVCPYCGHDYRFQTGPQYAQAQPGISEGMKIVFYILSLLIWVVGIVIGLVYYTKPDPESKHVGKICLILGCVSIVLEIGLSLVLYVMILGFHG